MSFTGSALIVSWAAIALLGFALAGVLARVHRLELALAGGDATPASAGGPLTVRGVERGPVLVLFVDDGCASCDEAAEAVTAHGDTRSTRIVRRHDDPEAFGAMDVTATPVALVADEELRVVATIPVGSAERLDDALGLLDDLEGRASR